MSSSSPFRIRVATVADAEPLMRFGRQAFDDTFSGHPKNHPDDMALYMNEAFTVEQFAKEISNNDTDDDGHAESKGAGGSSSSGGEGGAVRNVFLIAEQCGSNSNEGGEGKGPDDTPTGTIVGYCKLCVHAIEEGIIVSDEHTKESEEAQKQQKNAPEGAPAPQTGAAAPSTALTTTAMNNDSSNRKEEEPSTSSFSHFHPKTIELGRLYVGKAFRGQRGIGTKLMDEAYRIAKEEGCTVMWLGVWEYNDAAKRFYEHKHGFRFVGQHVFQLGTDPQIDLLMQKEL